MIRGQNIIFIPAPFTHAVYLSLLFECDSYISSLWNNFFKNTMIIHFCRLQNFRRSGIKLNFYLFSLETLPLNMKVDTQKPVGSIMSDPQKCTSRYTLFVPSMFPLACYWVHLYHVTIFPLMRLLSYIMDTLLLVTHCFQIKAHHYFLIKHMSTLSIKSILHAP